MSTEPGAPVEFRPDWDQYTRWFRRPSKAHLGLLLIVLAGVLIDQGIAIAMAAVVVGVAIGMSCATLSLRSSRVRLGEREIHYRSWFRDKSISTDRSVRGLLAVYSVPLDTRKSELLVLQSGDSGAKIRLNGAYWLHDDLAAIASFAGVESTGEELSAKDFERRAPGIMRPWERRPILGAVVAGAASFVVLFIVVAGYVLITD